MWRGGGVHVGNVLSGSQKRWLCQLLTLSETEAKHFVALLIGLHDIGKASSDFQAKVPSLFQRLLAIGFEDNRTRPKTSRMGCILATPCATSYRHGVGGG
jgi:hypothetical protein